ncbi:F0F1 ATP synthase subunit delta [Thomasclavelia sp.]
MDAVAVRYAESLFDLAKEVNQVEAYSKDIDLIRTVFESDPSFVPFFSHVLIEDEAKCALLDKSFKGQVNDYVVNFLKLLVRKKRMRYVMEIIEAFKALTNEHFGILEGILYAYYNISVEEVREVESALSKRENKTIHLRVVNDPSLIGGIKVEINNRVFDGSIKNKVALLKKELLRK